MTFRELYRKLEKHNYYIFSNRDISTFCPGQKKDNLTKLFYRWVKQGWIYRLKKGLYELTYPGDFSIPDMHIANRLYSPSYVSLETALSNYSIIPEVSMAVTSITTRLTRRFKNKHGLFIYHTVRPDAFSGYYLQKQGEFSILIAEPEKALVDYLYFKGYRSGKLDFKEERFDKGLIRRLDRGKLDKYAGLYKLNLKEFYAYL